MNSQKGGNKKLIVFIHGNSSSSKVFNQAIESGIIKDENLAIDLPGHAENRELKGDLSFDFYKEFLLAKINELDSDILLVGHSLGGHLAIEIADKIRNLKGLVIFGTPPLKNPPNLEDAFLPSNALNTLLTEDPTKVDLDNFLNNSVLNEDVRATVLEDFNATNPKVRPALAHTATTGNFENEYEIFTQLSVPKFILMSDKDPIPNTAYLLEVQKNCENTCEIIKFDNCGHYISLESPNMFAKTISNIVDKTF